jgi:hypothetical protein
MEIPYIFLLTCAILINLSKFQINNIRKTVKTGSAEREDVLMEEGGIRDAGDKARRVPHQRKTPRRLLSKDTHKD